MAKMYILREYNQTVLIGSTSAHQKPQEAQVQIKNQRHTSIHQNYNMQFSELTNGKQKCSKNKQSHQNISGHQWPHKQRRQVMRKCLLIIYRIALAYYKHDTYQMPC